MTSRVRVNIFHSEDFSCFRLGILIAGVTSSTFMLSVSGLEPARLSATHGYTLNVSCLPISPY